MKTTILFFSFLIVFCPLTNGHKSQGSECNEVGSLKGVLL